MPSDDRNGAETASGEGAIMPDAGSDCWEGGPRLDEAVTAYLDAVGDGLVPDRRAPLAEYSDVALRAGGILGSPRSRWCGRTPPLCLVAAGGDAAARGRRGRVFPGLDEETVTTAHPYSRLAAVLEARGYELLVRLSRGGAGVVYKVRPLLRLNWLVAVKTIGVGRQVSPLDLERFRNEAEILGGLHQP